MACPTCQRPIQFVGQPQPGAPAAAPRAAGSGGAGPRLPQAAPLARPEAPAIGLEPAPAAPKYSAEASQFALQPATAAASPPKREEQISPVVLITWIVLGLLVAGSGAIVVVASFQGLSHEPAASTPTRRPPPPPSATKGKSATAASTTKGAGASAATTTTDTDSESSATSVAEEPKPFVQKAMPSVGPVVAPASRPAVGSPLPMSVPTPMPMPFTAPRPEPPGAVGRTDPPSTPPTPMPVVEKPPAKPTSLDGLDDAWRLPALISTAEEPLSTLTHQPTEPVNISLSSTAANLGETAALFVERGESGLWTVFYVADLQKPEAKTALGTLRLSGRQFSFAWKSLELPELRKQVANCRLIVHHGSDTKAVQLRAVQQEAAIRLDLERAVQVRELTIGDPPKLDLIRLEITELAAFEGTPNVVQKSLPVGKQTKIEFTEPPGAEIEVRFQKLPTGNLAVRLEPLFREGESKEFDLTLPRLKAMEDGVTRALRTAERELPAEKRELAAKTSALRRLKGSQPGNPLEIPAWRNAVSAMAGDVDRTTRKVARLTNDIPLHKARLEAVPKIREFLVKMNQTATIRLRVVAECGEHDVVLVEASLDAPSAE